MQVNRDPMAAEMQRMRHQLEVMQAELICARGGGPSTADIQVIWCRWLFLQAMWDLVANVMVNDKYCG